MRKDFNVIKNIIENFSPNLHFSWSEVIDLKNKNPYLFEENSSIERNEGSQLGLDKNYIKEQSKSFQEVQCVFVETSRIISPRKNGPPILVDLRDAMFGILMLINF